MYVLIELHVIIVAIAQIVRETIDIGTVTDHEGPVYCSTSIKEVQIARTLAFSEFMAFLGVDAYRDDTKTVFACCPFKVTQPVCE